METFFHRKWQKKFQIQKWQHFAISTFARVGKIGQAQKELRSEGWHSSCLSSLTGYWYVDMSISLTRKTKLDPSNVNLFGDSRANIPLRCFGMGFFNVDFSFLPLQKIAPKLPQNCLTINPLQTPMKQHKS